jgi:TatD DNase family protein
MYVDSHCHLDDLKFQGELDQLIQRAKGNKVETLVTIGTSLGAIPDVQEIARKYPQVYYSVGIHPDEAHTLESLDSLKDTLCACAKDSKMVAFGETGIDYYHAENPRLPQQQSFRAHLQAAKATGLPVIIHCRGDGAEEDILRIIDEEKYTPDHIPGVIHCFTGSKDFAHGALDRGFYISLSGIITFKNAVELQAIAKALPLDRILIETDSPYLAPMPFRGKRNEPSFVVHTAAGLATLRNVSVETIAQTTTENFYKVFSKCQRP